MNGHNNTKKLATAALGIALLAPAITPFTPAAHANAAFADPALEKVWTRTDLPVDQRMAVRSWMWGPQGFYAGLEQYAQGPAGQHLVQYFDKSRMEVNDPSADRNSQWYVTNGLLVVDMIGGKVQVGDQQFLPASPANIPVAGDTGSSASPETPTYASLARVASLNGNNRAQNRSGQNIREGIGRDGNTSVLDNLASFAKYGTYEPTTGHNIADVFWSFLNSKGVVYQDGQYQNATVVDWLFAMGYPVTEPYWIKIKANGQERWVLMQAFQRRILTYSPYNADGWKVEMGNVGRAYYDWRYAQAAQTPTPTATPAPVKAASLSISPTTGDTATRINVAGKNFPPNAAVTIAAEQPSANYFRTLATVGVKGDGSFATTVNLPADAARLGQVAITATANTGGVRVTKPFQLNYDPAIEVLPNEIVTGGGVQVRGSGFPANANINLGLHFTDGSMEWLTRTRAGADGSFDARINIGNRQVNATFKVVALADGGFKATSSNVIRVLAQPSLLVTPGSGPAAANVILRGTDWPAGRAIAIKLRRSNSTIEAQLPNLVVADAGGSFAVTLYIGPEYSNAGEVRLAAYEPVSTLRLEAAYRVIAPAREATVAVSPNVLTVGQVAAVAGTNWQAGTVVSIGVGRPGYPVEEWIASARVDGNRNIATNFVLGPRWQNAGQLVVTATVPGSKTATTLITVVSSAGRIVPSGLPMTVNVFTDKAGQKLYKLNAQGWQPGANVNIDVVSADGTVSVPAAAAIVGANGTFQASFYAVAPWAGRADLGIRAITVGGTQYSLRYAQTATLVRTTGNSYTVSGANWAPNSLIDAVEYDGDNGSKGDGQVARTVQTDANGAFTFTIDLPRTPGNQKIDFELRARDLPYSATFDY